MIIRLVQLAVERDIERNLDKILRQIEQAETGEWIIFPEAMLSGYAPEEDTYLERLDAGAIMRGLAEIAAVTRRKSCVTLVGSATLIDGAWFNSVILSEGGREGKERIVHNKRELSFLDKRHFTRGRAPTVQTSGSVTFGIQACREVLFPEAWSSLRRGGAQMVFHLNNALKSKDAIWEHLLISRAVENGMFVCSVNNASHPQTLGSYLIAPHGLKLIQMTPQREYAECVEIDLSSVPASASNRKDF